jgi:ATP-dependent protease ClpP protease subunit
VIELFGDIGTSRDGDPWWGEEGGAGTFQEFASELRALGPCPELRVEIHSYGGSVIVGKGIHDKLLEHPANKTAIIYGVCASAATYAALACQKVQIPANSFFLIHNSSGICMGNASDMQRCAENLEVCDESIANLYASRTGKSVDEIRDLMDKDVWVTGTEAFEIGLADEVISPVTIDRKNLPSPENFRSPAHNSIPAGARPWFDMSALTSANTRNASLNMKIRTPLMNAVSDPAAPAAGSPGGVPAVTAPAVVPAAPAVTPPAVTPTNAVAPTAPTNVIQLTQEQLQTMMTQAATNAVAPLQAELNRLSGLNAAGITPQNLAGAPPVAGAAPVNEGTKALTADDMKSMSPMQLINHGRKQLAASGKTIPLQS